MIIIMYVVTQASHYRFSIAWPRIMPDGTPASINAAGIAYYDRLIDALCAAGIEPMVTLYHWDLPQTLQDQGGFTNPSMPDWFNDYAITCYEKFGDRVSADVTIGKDFIQLFV